MPLLLSAAPLEKTWLGTHCWKTPSIMDLPVELEYIPYQEFEDRFARLNKIARSVYPTFWPDAAMLIVFVGLFTAAIVGVSKTGSKLTILSQGSCFILPVMIVLWTRVRKGIKDKAYKTFKQQSQKLLRTWTAQDLDTHAIQWKLRRRPKSVAKRWRGVSAVQNLPHDERTIPNYTNAQPDIGHIPPQVPVVVLVEERVQGHDLVGRETSPLPETSVSSASPIPPITSPFPPSPAPATPTPRAVADVYSALRRPTATTTTTTTITTTTTTTTTATPAIIPSQLLLAEQQQQQSDQYYSQAGLSTRADFESPETPEAAQTEWTLYKAFLQRLCCCGVFSREGKIWMIEISIREGVLDEYSVPVPSPAYCDYRLPGYEDVMSGNFTSTTSSPLTSSGSRTTSGTARAPIQPRYIGSPPAYESDSENDSDNEDDGEEAQEEDVQDRNESSQGPIEMTAVIVSSAPVGSHPSARLTTTASGEAVAAGAEQDITTVTVSPLPSQPPSAVISGSALPSIALGDKSEGSSSTNKQM